MLGLQAGSMTAVAREAAYGEVSAEGRRTTEVVGLSKGKETAPSIDLSELTPRSRARERAKRGRRQARRASGAAAADDLAAAVDDYAAPDEAERPTTGDLKRQLGPTKPTIDPYGSYHLPLAYDTDRLAHNGRAEISFWRRGYCFAARPLDSPPTNRGAAAAAGYSSDESRRCRGRDAILL